MQSRLVTLARAASRHVNRSGEWFTVRQPWPWAGFGRSRWTGLVTVLACCVFATSRAVDVQVDVELQPRPENAAIYVGDTVVWVAKTVMTTESFTGEWTSPILKRGQSFSYTFTKPGTFVYRSGWYSDATPPSFYGYYVGTVAVQPLSDARPAVSIVAPPDGFFVKGYVTMRAAVTNTPAAVRVVNFFREDQLIGTATNAPYDVFVNLGVTGQTYEFRARVIDNAGVTNISPAVNVTFASWKMFKPFRLPQGQFVCFYSAPQAPTCVLWSEHLKGWNDPMVGQDLGDSTYVDETSTNTVVRFYTLQPCL